MSSIVLQIKIVDLGGAAWNINVDDIALVRYPDPAATLERRAEKIFMRNSAQVVDVPDGAYMAAIEALKAEYASNPKAAQYLAIGTTP